MCLIAKLWERPPRFAVLPNDFADKHISKAGGFLKSAAKVQQKNETAKFWGLENVRVFRFHNKHFQTCPLCM